MNFSKNEKDYLYKTEFFSWNIVSNIYQYDDNINYYNITVMNNNWKIIKTFNDVVDTNYSFFLDNYSFKIKDNNKFYIIHNWNPDKIKYDDIKELKQLDSWNYYYIWKINDNFFFIFNWISDNIFFTEIRDIKINNNWDYFYIWKNNNWEEYVIRNWKIITNKNNNILKYKILSNNEDILLVSATNEWKHFTYILESSQNNKIKWYLYQGTNIKWIYFHEDYKNNKTDIYTIIEKNGNDILIKNSDIIIKEWWKINVIENNSGVFFIIQKKEFLWTKKIIYNILLKKIWEVNIEEDIINIFFLSDKNTAIIFTKKDNSSVCKNIYYFIWWKKEESYSSITDIKNIKFINNDLFFSLRSIWYDDNISISIFPNKSCNEWDPLQDPIIMKNDMLFLQPYEYSSFIYTDKIVTSFFVVSENIFLLIFSDDNKQETNKEFKLLIIWKDWEYKTSDPSDKNVLWQDINILNIFDIHYDKNKNAIYYSIFIRK